MVRTPFVDENGIRKGAWSKEEDDKLRAYVQRYGHWNWTLLPKFAGLSRSGKSCRLRWLNYLKPGLKRGNFSQQEQDQIINLHARLGKKWSTMALELPGRTDNEIKNFWYGHVEKRNGKQTICRSEMSCDAPNSQESRASNQNEELASTDSSISITDDSNSSAGPVSSDFWTQPFELDTDAHVQDSLLTPFLEEDLQFYNVDYYEYSNFGFAC